MRMRAFAMVCACIAFVGTMRAQEGHPLVGTWHGTWGLAGREAPGGLAARESPGGLAPREAQGAPAAAQRTDVTLVLEFDGKAITGMMNPGPDSIRFGKVTLDPATWSVRFEATPRAAGAAPIVIEATIQDVTNRHRSLVGTWTQGATKADFKASRDD